MKQTEMVMDKLVNSNLLESWKRLIFFEDVVPFDFISDFLEFHIFKFVIYISLALLEKTKFRILWPFQMDKI